MPKHRRASPFQVLALQPKGGTGGSGVSAGYPVRRGLPALRSCCRAAQAV